MPWPTALEPRTGDGLRREGLHFGRNIHVDVTQMSMTWLGGRVESI